MSQELYDLEVEYIANQKQIIADFSCGTPTKNAAFKYDFYAHMKTPAHKRVVCETQNLRYTADNTTSDPSKNYLNKYVAVVNKSTGKMKVYDAEIYKFYPVSLQDDDVNIEQDRELQMKKHERDERTFAEKADMLTEAFGSKKKQKMMVSRLRNNVSNTTSAVTQAVEKMVAEGKDFSVIENNEATLFDCNYDAMKPEDAYKFNDIIPEAIRNACVPEAECLMDPQKSEIQNWHTENDIRAKPYISWHATHTHSAVRANEAIHHEFVSCLQIIIYLATAYKFKRTKKTPHLKSIFPGTISKAVLHWISENYTINGTAIPTRCKDKLLATAIIVAWHIDSFQFDLQMIADLFDLSSKKLSFIVRALGGIVRNSKKGDISTSFAVLRIPVQRPKEDHGTKRGGRR